jgi:predicted transcriptional regulator
MLLAQMERETRLGAAIPSDCRSVLAPLISADLALTDSERHLISCFARKDAEVINICEAAEMSGSEPGEIEVLLEALADVHLIEPLELGCYRLPRFVQMYFGLRTPALTG